MSDINALIEWINSNGVLEIPKGVDIDYLADEKDAAGLYKIPEVVKEEYIDGVTLITEHYILLAKKVAGIKGLRLKAVSVLEAFEEWIEEQNEKENFPNLKKGKVEEITISSPIHLEEAEASSSIYQCTLAITYLKEKRRK